MQPNFIDKAEQFYKNTPIQHVYGKKRTLYTKQLFLVIETAPFLTNEEKEQMKKLVPLYSTKVIHNLKQSLIRQGLLFLQLNPDYKKSIGKWLKENSKDQF